MQKIDTQLSLEAALGRKVISIQKKKHKRKNEENRTLERSGHFDRLDVSRLLIDKVSSLVGDDGIYIKCRDKQSHWRSSVREI